jgi:hypothetical protein
VAYSIVDKSGDRVYVRPFDGTSGPFLIDANAQDPKWSANGRELFYTSSVFPVLFRRKIATTPAAPLPASTAVELKRLPSDIFALNYDVLRDGRVRRVNALDAPAPENPPIQVVLNWFEELKQRVPVR